MIEEQLRAELAAHMAGATPVTDWATPAIRNTERRHRRQLAGTVAATVALVGIMLGVVILPRHGQRSQLQPAAPGSATPRPATPSPAPHPVIAGDTTVIQDAKGGWSVAARTAEDPVHAICVDLTRIGVQTREPVSACAPADPFYASYHHAYLNGLDSPATIDFGLAPKGTTAVDLVSGTGSHVTATLAQLDQLHSVLWAAQVDTESTAAVAHESNGTSIDLLSAQKKTCGGDGLEVAEIAPCPSATPPTTPTAPVQSGYGHDETFCSAQGELHYVVSNGSVTLTSTLTGLPKDTLLGFNWINNAVRGYNIAAETTTVAGTFDSKTLNMFRPGEVRGIAMQVTNGNAVILRLKAC